MKRLKKYLIINSAFSMLSGLVMLLFPKLLNQWFQIKNDYVFPVIGFCLLFFSIFVGYIALKHLSNKKIILIISLLDFGWVWGSIILIIFNPFDLSQQGLLLTGIAAIWITFLCLVQYRYNR